MLRRRDGILYYVQSEWGFWKIVFFYLKPWTSLIFYICQVFWTLFYNLNNFVNENMSFGKNFHLFSTWYKRFRPVAFRPVAQHLLTKFVKMNNLYDQDVNTVYVGNL